LSVLQNNEQKLGDTRLISEIKFPELFFGLVAPIGIETKEIAAILSNCLAQVDYKSHVIKVTKLMKSIRTDVELHETPLEQRYNSYIDYANKVRELLNDEGSDRSRGNDALAMLTVAAIMDERKSKSGSETKPVEKQAYIIDQLKRPEEIQLLRKVYGKLFVQISIHSTKHNRLHSLNAKIKKSHSDSTNKDYSSEAENLIRRDLSEEEKPHGQRVVDAFHLADVIIDANDKQKTKKEIKRFVDLLFGNNFITPTRDEYGMYAAKNASLRSADLSRQVGAAIFSKDGEVITMGSNEVPKPGGGTYFEGDEGDQRDFTQGGDYNENEKYAIVREFVKRLDDSKSLSPEISQSNSLKTLDEKVEYLLNSGPELKKARVMDLLEFGRQVHAEMNAICDAARLGKSIKDSTLFCTTFPCHVCAKLILAAGISRVIYIEPYPKSYAEDMYSESIALEENNSKAKKVLFQPFTGIAPFRYRDLFEKGKRKIGGIAQDWKDGKPTPNVGIISESYIELEPRVVAQMASRIAKLK
jgi:deoxycytidylate deaminase